MWYNENMEERMDFELFKSQICHRVKREGDIDFIINVLQSDDIAMYFEKKWHPECLYLLAMIDYLCRIHDMPLVPWYDDLRKAKFNDILYPMGILIQCWVSKDEKFKEESLEEAIPEFLRHNIVESRIRDVC